MNAIPHRRQPPGAAVMRALSLAAQTALFLAFMAAPFIALEILP